MKKYLPLIGLGLLFSVQTSIAQTLSAPQAQGVFGGLVGDFEVFQFDSDSICVVAATDSPNSIFFAKAHRNGNFANNSWHPLPSADTASRRRMFGRSEAPPLQSATPPWFDVEPMTKAPRTSAVRRFGRPCTRRETPWGFGIPAAARRRSN